MKNIATIPHIRWLVLVAVVFTALNCLKPVCIDDTLYYYNARQIASEPLHPYGERLFWNDLPEPAVQVLAPPLFSYYLAGAIELFGERPLLWKVWLLPYALLLVFGLAALFRRFAPEYELPLTIFVIFSPVFLPSFNLMLEVPVAALALTAFVVFFRAADKNSYFLAAAAGLVTGVAMQTKYSAFTVPVVMLVYAVIFGKIRLALLSTVIAAAVFAAIELFIVSAIGRSQWLYQSNAYTSVHLLAKYAYLAWPFVTLAGSVIVMLGPLALIAQEASKKWVVGYLALIATGFLAITFLPSTERPLLVENVVFGILGIAVIAGGTVVVWHLLEVGRLSIRELPGRIREKGIDHFLLFWLVIEIASYFLLAPIPAVRRMTLLLVVGTLILGRMLALRGAPLRRRMITAVVTANVMLGGLFYSIDLRDAYVEKVAVEQTTERLDSLQVSSTRWYVGRWGFQFYAEHAGMMPIFPGESALAAGDYVAISDSPYWTEPLAAHLRGYELKEVDEVVENSNIPLATMIGFYNSGIPIHHQTGPNRTVRIYRIVR